MLPVDPLAVISFSTNKGNMDLMTEAAVQARRTIAANIEEDTIKKLQAKPDPRKPDLELMQTLYDSGLRQCPMSGMPVFDPSKCSTTMKHTLWKAYCGIALAIDDASKAAEAAATLDELKAELQKHAPLAASH